MPACRSFGVSAHLTLARVSGGVLVKTCSDSSDSSGIRAYTHTRIHAYARTHMHTCVLSRCGGARSEEEVGHVTR